MNTLRDTLADLRRLLLEPPDVLMQGIGLVFTSRALLASQGFLMLARQQRRLAWLPFVSAMYDVSTISALLLLLARNEPAAGLNSRVVWACSPLAVLSSTLRNDVRVTLFAGVLAIAQFGAIVAWYMLGDQSLRHAAGTLRLELKRSEPLIRVGGEEFVLILDKPIGAAWEYLDWLRRKLAAHPFDTEPGMAARDEA
jgi:hypothetical protein